VWIALLLVFCFGVYVGMTQLGVWYALYKLGQAEMGERRRRIHR
jgi:hypothetical protein